MANDMKAAIHRFRLRQASPPEVSESSPRNPSSLHRRRSASPRPDQTAPVGSRPTAAAAATGSRVSVAGAGTGRFATPSCDRCRSSKKKCSRTYPICDLCANAGQKCSYSNPASMLEGQVHRLGARLQWLSRYINDNLMPDGSLIEDVETGSDLSQIMGGPPLYTTTATTSRVVQNGIETSPQSGTASEIPGDSASGRPMKQNPSSLIGTGSTSGTVNNSPINPESVGSHLSLVSPSTEAFKVTASHILPSDTAARLFVDAYFRNVNRAYPLVDRAKILAELDELGEFTSHRREVRSTLLHLVMAIGCTTLERAGQIPRDTIRRFEVAYLDIIQECLGHETIESIQILVLLALYSLFDPAGTSSYSIVGIAARQAILIGLSRRSSSADGTQAKTPAEVEQGHRLYWSLFVLDRVMAVSQGLPVALTDDDSDVPLPSLTVEEFASSERATFARNLQTSRHVIQLRQLEGKILHHIHFGRRSDVAALSASDRRAMLAGIRTEVEDWYSNGCLLSPLESDNVPVHSGVAWLSARYYHLLVMLYYPNHFNASAGAISPAELLSFTRHQLQSTWALFQQRKLPLNRATICRLFPEILVLMHDFAAHHTKPIGVAAGNTYAGASDTCPPYAARDEVGVLISILEAFPDAWAVAHEAAQLVRQFAGVISGVSNNAAYFDQQPAYTSLNTGTHAGFAGDLRDDGRELTKPCIKEMTVLMQSIMGKTTCYQFIEDAPAENATDKTKVGGGVVGQPTYDSVDANRGIMEIPPMEVTDYPVMNYAWGLDLDFL